MSITANIYYSSESRTVGMTQSSKYPGLSYKLGKSI